MPEGPRENADSPGAVPGATNPRILSLDRFPIRTREATATLSAWRLAVACEEGEGAIVRVDASASERFHRGEGIFLGWPEDRLAAAYDLLRPVPAEPAFEIHQLG
jgi:hypothetical protein